MLLLGLWVGSGHPHMHQFLQPLVGQLTSLAKGVQITDEFTEKVMARVVVLALILDLMAKVCFLTPKNTHIISGTCTRTSWPILSFWLFQMPRKMLYC